MTEQYDTVKTAYDFGMNNGDDVEYYLAKGFRVVGVEANSALVDKCRIRFQKEIASAQVVLVNVALTSKSSSEPVPFYIHKIHHVLSQLNPPAIEDLPRFDVVHVPQRKPSEIVREYGPAHYIKIDVEHFDQVVLTELFANGIRPPHISAESHSVEVFAALVAAGYTAFNLVEGRSVTSIYGRTTISTPAGSQPFEFNEHSAGPCIDDILTPWMDRESFFYFLASAQLGWKDIHATTAQVPTVSYRGPDCVLNVRQHLSDLFPSIGRSISYRLRALRKAPPN